MRLIDADVARRIADKELFADEAGAVQFVLSHCPTIEAEPVKHGRWVEEYSFGCWHYDCSVCNDGYATQEQDENTPNYFPNCGAKMRSDDE